MNHEIKVIVDDKTMELLEDATTRSGDGFQLFIRNLLTDAAAKEYATQQQDDARC